MDQIAPTSATLPKITSTETTEYRCDGYVVTRGIMGSHAVAACNAVPSDLSAERLPARDTVLKYEGGPGPAILPPEQREFTSSKCMDFVHDAQAVEMWTMNHPPHALPDREFGDGRVLFQEMELVKPPHMGLEKWWRQDAAYFCQTDPGLIIGGWMAQDSAPRENGCMELVPGSQLDGAVSHRRKNDFYSSRIASQHARAAERIAIELQTGDAPILHALLYQYFSPSASKLHRHAMQYHYYQIGMMWGDVAVRRRMFRFVGDGHGGCTIPREPVPPGAYIYRSGLERPIVPIGPLD
jgi:phytanoyl-CoA hydroxylase